MFAAVVALLALHNAGAPVSDAGQKEQCFFKLLLSFPSDWGFGEIFFLVFCFEVVFLNRKMPWSEILGAFCVCVLWPTLVSRTWIGWFSDVGKARPSPWLPWGQNISVKSVLICLIKILFEHYYRCEEKWRGTCQPSAFPSHSTPHLGWANTGPFERIPNRGSALLPLMDGSHSRFPSPISTDFLLSEGNPCQHPEAYVCMCTNDAVYLDLCAFILRCI